MIELVEWILLGSLFAMLFSVTQALRLKGEAEGIERLIQLATMHKNLIEFVSDILEHMKKEAEK